MTTRAGICFVLKGENCELDWENMQIDEVLKSSKIVVKVTDIYCQACELKPKDVG